MIFLAVGSSLGNRYAYLEAAKQCLAAVGVIVRHTSRYYETPPAGGVAQNFFLNAVWEVDFSFTGHALQDSVELLKRLKYCEALLGRDFTAKRWSDRIIDLDLLMFHQVIYKSDFLSLPHPQIPYRDFVLYPWRELVSPDFFIPKFGKIGRLILSLKSQAHESRGSRESAYPHGGR